MSNLLSKIEARLDSGMPERAIQSIKSLINEHKKNDPILLKSQELDKLLVRYMKRPTNKLKIEIDVAKEQLSNLIIKEVKGSGNVY